MELNIYGINGKFFRKIEADNIDNARQVIERVIEDIGFLTSTIAFCTRQRISWYPARYLLTKLTTAEHQEKASPPPSQREVYRFYKIQKYQEDRTWTVLSTDEIKKILDIYTDFSSGDLGSLEGLIRKSIDWFRLGICQEDPFNRFLNLFQALECLTHSIFEYLPKEFLPPKERASKKDAIMEILAGTDHNNCLQKVNQAYTILNASIKEEFDSFFKFLYQSENRNYFEEQKALCFDFYLVRNSIAHASLHESNADDIVNVQGQCWKLQEFVFSVICDVIDKKAVFSSLLKTVS